MSVHMRNPVTVYQKEWHHVLHNPTGESVIEERRLFEKPSPHSSKKVHSLSQKKQSHKSKPTQKQHRHKHDSFPKEPRPFQATTKA